MTGLIPHALSDAEMQTLHSKLGGSPRRPTYNEGKTVPPACRAWVGLTNEDRKTLISESNGTLQAVVYAVEAKLKELNT